MEPDVIGIFTKGETIFEADFKTRCELASKGIPKTLPQVMSLPQGLGVNV